LGTYLILTRQRKGGIGAAAALAAFTHAPFRGSECGGGSGMRFACLFKQARSFSAAECGGFWCGGQRITFGFGFRITAAQISNTGQGIFGPRGPKACFIGQACAAGSDGTGFGRQGALRITRSHFKRALFRQIGARCFHAFAKLRQVRRSFARLQCTTARRFGFGQFSADAFQLRGKSGEAVFYLRRAIEQRSLTLARFRHRGLSATTHIPRGGFGITCFGFSMGGGLFRLTQQGHIGARGIKRLGFQACGIGPGAFLGKACQLRFKGDDTAFGAGIACGQFTFSPAGGGCCDFSGAARIARGGFGACSFGASSFGGNARGFRLGRRDFGLVQPRFGGAQSIALGKAHSTRRGCAGVMRMAIPTPDSAFFRHQRLAGPQPCLQRRTIHTARQQTNL
jgi:hypothetical protein